MSESVSVELERIDDLLARLLAQVTPLPAERIAVSDETAASLIGRTLAEPLYAAVDHPPFDVSAMDGWVTTLADGDGASSGAPRRLACVGDAAAGHTLSATPLGDGECQRIATGAPIPQGATTVIPVERSSIVDPERGGVLLQRVPAELPAHVWVSGGVKVGAHIRRRGEDQRVGSLLAEAGATIDAGLLAVIFSSGATDLSLVWRPRVALLTTGDELLSGAANGGIRDSNGPALAALIAAEGGEVVARAHVGDTAEATGAVVAALAAQADLLVTTGGVSVGAHDHVGAALATTFELVVWRLAIQPGKPLLLGRRRAGGDGALWAIGLPGNPVSAFVVGVEVALPLLRALAGRPAGGLRAVGLLEERVESPLGRRSFLRLAALRDEDGAPLHDPSGRVRVRLAGEQGSHQVSVLARTDYLGVVPEEIAEYAAGEVIELHPLPRASRRITTSNG